MDEKLKKKILNRKNEGTLRELSQNLSEIDFFSNDYLGLAKENFIAPNLTQGSSGSRLLSGNSNEAMNCENILSLFFDAEDALIFNSGYDANLGLISAVAQRGDYILYDEYIHASIRDGIKLSLASSHSFKHNDCDDLKRHLNSIKGTVYVVVESLYSMDGDMAPLMGIQAISEEHGAYLIIDEAHSGGVFGSNGRGIVHARGMQSKIFGRVLTFGKAYGYHGAVILCSSSLKEYLVNYCRSFIYTTALPIATYSSIAQRVQSSSIKDRQLELHENITYFREKMLDFDILSEENSPIQVLEFDNKEALLSLVKKMINAGIYTKPIFPPTVPKDAFRIRLCIHSFNSKEEIDLLVSCLK